MNWQPIETAPMDGTPVFCYWKPINGVLGCNYGVAAFDGSDWTDPDDLDIQYNVPSHWMPLPEPPK